MKRKHIFIDEAGNFDFSEKGSKYFILTSVVGDDFAVGSRLAELGRDMAWRGIRPPDGFHATEDLQSVRDEVFPLIAKHDLRIDATILTKARTYSYLRSDHDRFYKTAWYYHLKYVVPQIVLPGDELLVMGATLGTRAKQGILDEAIQDVVSQVIGYRSLQRQAISCSSRSEPCLQVADYCCWAIQRKWERHDDRSYILLKDKIESEYRLF